MRFSLLTSAILFATTAFSAPITEPEAALEIRQQATNCGGVSYSSGAVAAAVNKGYNYYSNGQQVGSNNYPHTYNNREGFDFAVSGPYQEFPLLKSGATYSGGEFNRRYVSVARSLLTTAKALLARTVLFSTPGVSGAVPSLTPAHPTTDSLDALAPARLLYTSLLGGGYDLMNANRGIG
jgi:hypothetical protein